MFRIYKNHINRQQNRQNCIKIEMIHLLWRNTLCQLWWPAILNFLSDWSKFCFKLSIARLVFQASTSIWKIFFASSHLLQNNLLWNNSNQRHLSYHLVWKVSLQAQTLVCQRKSLHLPRLLHALLALLQAPVPVVRVVVLARADFFMTNKVLVTTKVAIFT